MDSSGNNQTCEGRNIGPFFPVPPVTQQPLLGPWYQNPTYNPLSIPGAGFTNGSLYFPCPMVFIEYPGFLVPQSPLPTALNQRPIVPLFYSMAPQYGGHCERMKTKDTQTETEPQQDENLNENEGMPSEGDSRDIGRVTSNPTNTLSPENVGEKKEVESSSYPEGHVPSPTWLAQVDKVDGTTQGDTKQCCVAQSGQSPESASESSKGPWWRYSDSFESDDDDNYSDSSEEYFHSPVMSAPAPLPSEVGEGVQLQEKPQQMPSGGESHTLCERCHSSPLSTVYRVSEGVQCDIRKDAEQMESGNQDEDEYEEEVENNSEELGSSPPWSAQLSTVDEGIQCDIRKDAEQMESGNQDEDEYEEEVENNSEELGSSPPWSAQLSTVDEGIQCDIRKDAEQMESGNQDEDEYEEEVENNSEEHSVSPTWEVQFNEVDEGIQYGVSWFESQLETYPHQMPSRGKETLPDCQTKRSWRKPVMNRKLGPDEESMKDETGEASKENFKRSEKIKKTVRGRKLKDQGSFPNVKTVCLLKKSAALNMVIPEDSGASELGEEGEDEMDEVECFLEEVSLQSPLTASKGRSYQKAGRMLRVPPESALPPQLIAWPTRNKYKLLQVRGGYERIPEVYQSEQQDGCESSGDRLRSKHTMARLKGLESKRASHK